MVDVFKCERAAVFHNTDRLTPSQTKERFGCSHVLNAGFFVSDPDNPRYFEPLSWLVIDGNVISRDEYDDFGFALGDGWGPEMSADKTETHIYLVPILKDGKRLLRDLTPDVARPAERAAVAWFPNGKVLLWCDKAIMDRRHLQATLLSYGCTDALMCDGGGSVQGDFPNGIVESSRMVPTYLLFWAEGYVKEEPDLNEKKKIVCLDAGHDAKNTANVSPDGSFYEHEFALDMAHRIKAILEVAGVKVVMTRTGGEEVTLAERCRISNKAGADLFVSFHSNAASSDGWSSARGWECYIYEHSGDRYKAARAILARVDGVAPATRTSAIRARSELYVIKHTSAPAVLIEHGFHTNKEDVAWMKNDAYRQRLAQAEAYGILDWLGIPVPAQDPPAVPAEAEQAVSWITEQGIMLGNEGGDMMLDQPVTRKQFAVMLWRYHQKFGG